MIITRTPYRISFFGGGTDYPAWFNSHGGAVLATAINKYVYVSCRRLPPFFQHSIRVAYSRVEETTSIEDIVHPTVRESLRFTSTLSGIEIHYDGDLPSRSGMGSSSAFTVGLLHALYGMKGQLAGAHQLSRDAIHVEATMANENVGCQDQVTTAHGGFLRVDFSKNAHPKVTTLTLDGETLEELMSNLVLLHTGNQRYATEVAKGVIDNMPKKTESLHRMREMVDEGIACLNQGSAGLAGFGELLDEAWRRKRELADQVSNDQIDEIYAEGKAAGATGGKLLGAGAGGFILFFVPRERRRALLKRLSGLVHAPFRFENEGTRVIYYDPDQGRDYMSESKFGSAEMHHVLA